MDDSTRAAIATLAAPTFADVAPDVAPCACGEVTAPDGACLNIGACERADAIATRGATGARAKVAPSAWTVRGRVD